MTLGFPILVASGDAVATQPETKEIVKTEIRYFVTILHKPLSLRSIFTIY
jgi:hypothetical protein